MPGTVRAELYEMETIDALCVLLAGDVVLAPLGEDGGELKRAARWVIEAHAVDVVGRYLAPAPQPPNLKVVVT
jgi:hypothetical protein